MSDVRWFELSANTKTIDELYFAKLIQLQHRNPKDQKKEDSMKQALDAVLDLIATDAKISKTAVLEWIAQHPSEIQSVYEARLIELCWDRNRYVRLAPENLYPNCSKAFIYTLLWCSHELKTATTTNATNTNAETSTTGLQLLVSLDLLAST